MERDADFTTILRAFMHQALRTPMDLARLTGISLATLGNWTTGKVRRPRVVNDVLKLARALGLDAQEATILLGAADHPPLTTLQPEAHKTKNAELLALLEPWPIPPTAEPVAALVRPPPLAPRHQLRPPVAD